MNSLYETFLQVKGTQGDGSRWIEGWATTPTRDRQFDVVLPEGAVFSLPMPLLFSHRHDEPIGAVVRAEVTKAGIRIRAKLTEGVRRADECFKLISDGALSAVSIGFRALKQTPLSDGGIRFDSWEWLETSVCSVPCNPEAKISIGKSLAYAANSRVEQPGHRKFHPGVKLISNRGVVKLISRSTS